MVFDGREAALLALAGLLDEFRHGRITDLPAERDGIDRHTGTLSSQWDHKFPGFPVDYFPFTSFRGEHYRGRRDAYLKSIIAQMLRRHEDGEATIVNPACVFGRHARDLAAQLGRLRVICSDIDPHWFRYYRTLRLRRLPGNLTFVKDNVFDPRLEVRPTAVVFFGACGSVSDAAIDYAIRAHSVYIMCRTCCHDNIGGNIAIAARPTLINRFFRFKNWVYGRMRQRAKYAGFYFSERYPPQAYPRSKAARSVSTSDEFQAVARYSAESDICRAIIDLDRCLHLVENGYTAWYRRELIVAEGRAQPRNALLHARARRSDDGRLWRRGLPPAPASTTRGALPFRCADACRRPETNVGLQ
jgi:hypothetical protein